MNNMKSKNKEIGVVIVGSLDVCKTTLHILKSNKLLDNVVFSVKESLPVVDISSLKSISTIPIPELMFTQALSEPISSRSKRRTKKRKKRK